MLLRGTQAFRSSNHPIDLMQVVVSKPDGTAAFKRPLYLAVCGEWRRDVSSIDAYQGYAWRYDIEHFFRLGKNRLHLNKHQTSDVAHEEAWWRIALVSYLLLYHSRHLAQATPYPWERYLSIYRNAEPNGVDTPSNTHRAMSHLLGVIGTPAAAYTPRGNPTGRSAGVSVGKRERHPIVFKGSEAPQTNSSGLGLSGPQSNPQIIDQLIKRFEKQLKRHNFSPQEIMKRLAKVLG